MSISSECLRFWPPLRKNPVWVPDGHGCLLHSVVFVLAGQYETKSAFSQSVPAQNLLSYFHTTPHAANLAFPKLKYSRQKKRDRQYTFNVMLRSRNHCCYWICECVTVVWVPVCNAMRRIVTSGQSGRAIYFRSVL